MANGSAESLPAAVVSPTPHWWRIAIGAGVLALTGVAYAGQDWLGGRGQAAIGLFCFIGIVAALSVNLRAVRWRTIFIGILLQVALALFVLKLAIPGPIYIEFFGEPWIVVAEGDVYQPGYELFRSIGAGVKQFLEFSDEGAKFVFGPLADEKVMAKKFGEHNKFVFAFRALPPIIFVSSFFTVLYHFGILQFIVRVFARAMMWLMGTSGAETLSATANVFMGQTEAPLIVKPYVARMTESELLALMVGGMATISGATMAVYIGMGADQVAILATSVMAAPAGLYLSKLMLPETGKPETIGTAQVKSERPHRNAIDAAAAGASDGLFLALNVAAMLIAFLAFLACIDFVLKGVSNGELSLKVIFSTLFHPLALLMGVEGEDTGKVADLLGIKLSANEFVAYLKLTNLDPETGAGIVPGSRSYVLSTFALTGFANFASIGIQLGGIGAMAPERRPDLARLGLRALLVGFLATMVNAALAGLLMG